jgi:putative ABC transport system permease protein
MSTAVLAPELEAPARPVDGGRPARRAVTRWSVRLFRREWKRQFLILALLTVAVAATTFGLGVVSNVSELKADPVFGTANTVISLPGNDTQLSADITAIQNRFQPSDVVAHKNLAIPGSVGALDLRAENPKGPYVKPTLRLVSGRFPSGPGEVAMTDNAAKILGVRSGGVWEENGSSWRVVGIVENPLNLLDDFALVAPGQIASPDSVSILVNAPQSQLSGLNVPSRTGVSVSGRGTSGKTAAEVLVLVLATIGLLFVGLLAVAGFTVMAQRRLRALGMLESLGATDRHVRRAMMANGAAVGVSAAVVGTLIGLAAWFAFAPSLQSIVSHRVNALDIPWWAVGAAMVLALVTAVLAAWWPARAVVRLPIVAALSGRPPRPQSARRFAAVGAVVLGAGLVLLAFGDQHRAGFIIGGTIATVVGLLLLAPLAIQGFRLTGSRVPISARLALRDLARYQARSGAALGAVTLAIAIAATIAISAAAAQSPSETSNLPNNQIVVYVAQGGVGSPVPLLTSAQLETAQAKVQDMASGLGAQYTLPLLQAYDPQQPEQQGPPGSGPSSSGYQTAALAHVIRNAQGMEIFNVISLYVATPEVLSRLGIDPATINPNTDIITSRTDLGGMQLVGFQLVERRGGHPDLSTSRPVIQIVPQLPHDTSAPSTLITTREMQAFGLQTIPTGWLIQTPKPLTAAQISSARKTAAAAGLFIETKSTHTSLNKLRDWATVAGIVLALGVLGMTVGLIRSETRRDLLTLSATGASSSTRRSLTGVTAGALALLGAVMGTAGAYAALLCWHRGDLRPLGQVPTSSLVLILVGLPLMATVGGWLLAGREPAAIWRQPLE